MKNRFCFQLKKGEGILSASESIKSRLIEGGFVFDEEKPDFIISIGGDGTFLKAIRLNPLSEAAFVGVNFGNLGFLCEYKHEEIENLIDDLLNQKAKVEEVHLLESTFNGEKHYAFNEFRVQSTNHETIVLDVMINGEFLEKFRGDGCCISSSYGSSGMNRSLGGAIIDRDLELLEFTEMAPIQNRSYQTIGSSIVLPKDAKIGIKNIKNDEIVISFDSRSEAIKNVDELKFGYSDKSVKVLKNSRNNYVRKLHEAFIYD